MNRDGVGALNVQLSVVFFSPDGNDTPMSKMDLNGIVEGLHGKFGNIVFRRSANGTVMSRRPDRTGAVLTVGQAAHHQRFREAVAFAKSALADPDSRAYYDAAAKARTKPVFALAVGDFFNAPVIGEIDLAEYSGQIGGKIAIIATDDIGVAGVSVTIRNATDNSQIEQGVALDDAGKWRYTATAVAPAGASLAVEVIATDRPGNKAVKIETKP